MSLYSKGLGWKKINGYDKILWLKLEKEMQESQLLLAASFQRYISCIFTHAARTDAKMNLQELQVYNLEQKIGVILRPNMILINYERSQRLSYPEHAKTLCLVCLHLSILQVIFTQLVKSLLNVYECDL